jgi:hypothetical protein
MIRFKAMSAQCCCVAIGGLITVQAAGSADEATFRGGVGHGLSTLIAAEDRRRVAGICADLSAKTSSGLWNGHALFDSRTLAEDLRDSNACDPFFSACADAFFARDAALLDAQVRRVCGGER